MKTTCQQVVFLETTCQQVVLRIWALRLRVEDLCASMLESCTTALVNCASMLESCARILEGCASMLDRCANILEGCTSMLNNILESCALHFRVWV